MPICECVSLIPLGLEDERGQLRHPRATGHGLAPREGESDGRLSSHAWKGATTVLEKLLVASSSVSRRHWRIRPCLTREREGKSTRSLSHGWDSELGALRKWEKRSMKAKMHPWGFPFLFDAESLKRSSSFTTFFRNCGRTCASGRVCSIRSVSTFTVGSSTRRDPRGKMRWVLAFSSLFFHPFFWVGCWLLAGGSWHVSCSYLRCIFLLVDCETFGNSPENG